jgi:acyl carrier protein
MHTPNENIEVATSAAEVKTRAREFIVANFYMPNQDGFTDAMSLLEVGVVDSTGVLEIIAFLQSTFGFNVEDDEIVPENLDSIERITQYVTRKTVSAP